MRTRSSATVPGGDQEAAETLALILAASRGAGDSCDGRRSGGGQVAHSAADADSSQERGEENEGRGPEGSQAPFGSRELDTTAQSPGSLPGARAAINGLLDPPQPCWNRRCRLVKAPHAKPLTSRVNCVDGARGVQRKIAMSSSPAERAVGRIHHIARRLRSGPRPDRRDRRRPCRCGPSWRRRSCGRSGSTACHRRRRLHVRRRSLD